MLNPPEAVAGGRTRVAGMLVVPATIFVALGLVAPVGYLFRYSLNLFIPGQFMVDGLTAGNYAKFFSDPYYLAVLWRTIHVSVVTTLICLVGGFPLAYVLARTQSRYKNLLVMAVILPLFLGNAVRAAGWIVAFGSRGALNAGLLAIGAIRQPIEIMYTDVAVEIGIIAVNLPFMVLTLQSVIESIDARLEEAAYSLGAAPLTMARRVLWPLAMPGILAGTILTFILAMNSYATPVLLGGPKFQTMGPLVYDQFIQQNNWPFGGAVSFVLMIVTLALTVLANLVVQRRYR
jgi:putative spermidine/putrescine transport system permease protein